MFKKTKLENGLRVASIKIPSVATSVGIFINTGAANETSEEYGLSHFLEHMAFKGTKKRTVDEIAREIEFVGGSTNAYTSYPHTAYYASVLNEKVLDTVEIILDSTFNSIFPLNEIETERKVINQEIAMYQDRPNALAFYNLQKALYGEQPIGGNIIGTHESLEKFNRDSFVEYVEKWYSINNSILVVAGDVDHDILVDKVSELTKDMKPRQVDSVPFMELSGGYETFNKNFEQVNLMMALPAYPLSDIRHTQITELLSTYLGSGMSSPIFKEIREKRGLVYSVHADSHGFRDSGYLYVAAGTTSDNVDEIIDVSLDIIGEASNRIDDFDFERAKNQSKMMVGRMQESTSASMRYVGATWLMGDEYLYEYSDIINSIDTITKDEVQRVAEHIVSQRPSFSLVGPVSNESINKVRLASGG